MHLAEGTLQLGHAVLLGFAAAPLLAWSLRGALSDAHADDSSRSMVAGATSLLFAATLLPIPVPVVGATSHICLTPLLALLLGLRRVIWPTFFVLTLQALFFAHGGITTLGANLLTLGVVGPAAGLAVALMGRGLGLHPAVVVGVACAIGSLAVYLADAVLLAASLSSLAPPNETFTAVLLGFAPIQLPLAVLEGFIAVGICRLLDRRRSDLLPSSLRGISGLSQPQALNLALLAVCVLLILPGCNYVPMDDAVFSASAESAGRPVRDILLDFSDGELGLAASLLIPFILGVVAGRSWERLGRWQP